MLGLIRTLFDLVLPHDPVRRVRALGLWMAGFSIFALAFAYTAQYGFGLQPCILCLYQRWPYRAAILLGLLAAFLARPHPAIPTPSVIPAKAGIHDPMDPDFRRGDGLGLPRVFLALCVVLFIIDAGIALFQVGVEQHWWHGTQGCTGGGLENLTPSALLAQIKSAPLVRCDEVQFEFLGLSMAAYNGLFALGLAAGLALALVISPTRRS